MKSRSSIGTLKGIGEKTKNTLLKAFKSVKRIKETSLEELAAHIGEAKAKILTDALKQQQTTII